MSNIDEKLYTSFPIPIIIKEDLEKTTGTVNGNITTYGNVHFFIMFNNRLLDKAELDKMLEEIQDRISNLTDKLQAKNNDIETAQSLNSLSFSLVYRSFVHSFSSLLFYLDIP